MKEQSVMEQINHLGTKLDEVRTTVANRLDNFDTRITNMSARVDKSTDKIDRIYDRFVGNEELKQDGVLEQHIIMWNAYQKWLDNNGPTYWKRLQEWLDRETVIKWLIAILTTAVAWNVIAFIAALLKATGLLK